MIKLDKVLMIIEKLTYKLNKWTEKKLRDSMYNTASLQTSAACQSETQACSPWPGCSLDRAATL